MARHVVVAADRLDPDAWTHDGAVTILAGGSHTFRISAPQPLTADALDASLVIVLNSLVGR